MSTPASEAEQKVQEDLYRLDTYRSQLNTLLQQHQLLTASRGDHLRARESLEGLDRTEPGTEILVPLGADTFLRGSALPGAKVLIGVGSRVVVEMERPKVSELLAQRLERLDKAASDLEGQIRTLDERVQAVSQRLDSLAQSAQDSERRGPGNVGGN